MGNQSHDFIIHCVSPYLSPNTKVTYQCQCFGLLFKLFFILFYFGPIMCLYVPSSSFCPFSFSHCIVCLRILITPLVSSNLS